MNLQYTQVAKIGSQLVSWGGGVRAYFDAPQGGPDWGVRFLLVLLYPRK
jgi:hypothetical protein